MIERSILQPISALKIDGSTYHHAGHIPLRLSDHARPGGNAARPQRHALGGWVPRRTSGSAGPRWPSGSSATSATCRFRSAGDAFPSSTIPMSYPKDWTTWHERIARRPRGHRPGGRGGLPAAGARGRPEGTLPQPGIKPEPEPNGCFVMPYVRAAEPSPRQLAGQPPRPEQVSSGAPSGRARRTASGCSRAWGVWRYWPAATRSPPRPAAGRKPRVGIGAALRAHRAAIAARERSTRSGSAASTFAGDLRGRAGPSGPAGDFRHDRESVHLTGTEDPQGRKSWFFFDDRIVCLGSDISCDEAEYPTQTTLCQRHLLKDKRGGCSRPSRRDRVHRVCARERTLAEDPAPIGSWTFSRPATSCPPGRRRRWRAGIKRTAIRLDLADTEGDFLTAWIDHGKAPAAARYEYVLVVRATPRRCRGSSRPPYRLQRDQAAHIVWDTAGRRWGCVFFVPRRSARAGVAGQDDASDQGGRPAVSGHG